jgi:hypothetical protein
MRNQLVTIVGVILISGCSGSAAGGGRVQQQDAGITCIGGRSGPNPSSKGGCCSEWIACDVGLTCEPDGPVYPGSLGICR